MSDNNHDRQPLSDEPSKRDNPVVYEIRLFFTSLMFYTRLPVPSWTGYSDDQLNRSTRYFPSIGWVVGGSVALTIFLLSHVLSTALSVCIALAFGVLLTGAFHEDGFADLCDGFGGGMTSERVLEIMKDSRVGAYGVIGTIMLFVVKISAMVSLITLEPWYGLTAVVFAHVLSRFCCVTIIFTDLYARADMTSKVKPIGNQISPGGLTASGLWLLPFIFLLWSRPWWFLAVPAALLARLRLGGWFRRRLGGYTGDCLGAAQQIMEVVTFITILTVIGVSAANGGNLVSSDLLINLFGI
jgi:adenosylcobinamide-GDP ribazoletransferase